MPKDLADLGERDARGHHLTGGRVAKPMRADRREPSPDTGAAHDRGHRSAAKSRDRRQRTHEHLASGGGRAPTPQIPGDRLADVSGQREPVNTPVLAVHHDLGRPPVNVLAGSTQPLDCADL